MHLAESPLFRNLITWSIIAGSTLAVVLFISHPIFSNDRSPAGGEELPEPPEPPVLEEQPAEEESETGFELQNGGQPAGDDPGPLAVEPFEESFRSMTFSVSGVVVDLAGGKPVTNRPFRVTAFSPGSAGGPIEAEVDRRTGRFVFTGLCFGPHILSASVEGYLVSWGDMMIPMEGRKTIGLERGGTVRIKATDAYARRLKEIRIWRAAGPETLFMEPLSSRMEDGFHVLSGLPEGVHELHLEAPDFERLILSVQVSKEEEHTYWALFD